MIMLLLAGGILGLCIGSFLNVVIYRLPIMLERHWRQECHLLLEHTPIPEHQRNIHFNLWFPRSHCPRCHHQLTIWENIPIVSYLVLRGRCRACQTHISLRYPTVELLSGGLSVFLTWHYGLSWQLAGALVFTWFLLAMSMIDINKQLLPDSLTLGLLWFGLLCSVFNLFADSKTAIIGAICAYSVLFIFTWIFNQLTQKQGMGRGDFKLFAALGTWLGWQGLGSTIIIASFFGAIIGLIILKLMKKHKDTPIPFGPFLALGGWISLIWGHVLIRMYLAL